MTGAVVRSGHKCASGDGMAFRPGRPRPFVARATVDGRTLDALPITPDMLNALTQAIAGGVTSVWYADRRVNFMTLDDLLRAWEWLATMMGLAEASAPTRRYASFSKGLVHGGYGADEHAEVWDALFSRGVPPDPDRRGDVDWERAR